MVLEAELSEEDIDLGGHSAAHCYEKKVEWYLGFFVAGISNDKLHLSYIMRSVKSDSELYFYRNIQHR